MNDTREYSIWNTPLSVLLRGRIGPGTAKVKRRIDPLASVRQSDLPEPAKAMIAQVVKKTRLWKYEKQEIAEELLAHFADGIEAGRSADDLIADFGEPRNAAKLMRRAKKRNRPLLWRMSVRTVQASTCFLLFYIALALLLSARHPNPRIDYIAALNASTANAPESERAWPIYRDAWAKARIWKLDDAPLRVSDKDRTGRLSRPGDGRWPVAVAFLRDHKGLLDALREAGHKPSLGWEFRAGGTETWPAEDRAAFTDEPVSKKPVGVLLSDKLISQSMIGVLLPDLSGMFASAVLLAADLRWAASQGDADRVLADYRALVGMAQQCGEAPILVNQHVEVGILAFADKTLMEINRSSPQSLEKCRVELLHVMSSTLALKMNLAGERMGFMDMVQRVYSDDGNGDGTPTLDGMRVMGKLSRIMPNPSQVRLTAVHSLALPAAAALMASRKELTRQAELFYATAQEDSERPLWVKLHARGKTDALLLEWHASRFRSIQYALLAMMAPFDRASGSFDQYNALHEAAMVALTLEAWHAKAGAYPDSLGELVPHYLPAVPVDRSTGGPLRYKLVDGKPLLYGLGKDGVDDGGVWVEDKATPWANVPAKGDWVLYPDPESAEPAKE